jgi:hypothetical protein
VPEGEKVEMRQSITLILLLGLVAGAAAGGGVPTLPHCFSGNVTIGSSPAPIGTVITAVIGGTEYGSIQTTEVGKYGDPGQSIGKRLLVTATADQSGETITFLVNGVAAEETAVFEVGGGTVLDLSVPGSGGTGGSGGSGSTGGSGSSGSSGGSGGSGSTGVSGTTRDSGESAAPTAAPTMQTGRASLDTSTDGVVLEAVTVRTVDETCVVAIQQSTIARGADGNPLGEITVARVDLTGVPATPPGTTVAIVLDCGPDGATFDPPVTLTCTLSSEEWAQIGEGTTPKIICYNPATKAWQDVPATVDPTTRTVTARVSHFSIYALAWTVPGTTVAQQTNTSAGGTPPAADEPPWLFISVGGLLLVGAVIGGLAYLRKKN